MVKKEFFHAEIWPYIGDRQVDCLRGITLTQLGKKSREEAAALVRSLLSELQRKNHPRHKKDPPPPSPETQKLQAELVDDIDKNGYKDLEVSHALFAIDLKALAEAEVRER